MSLEAVAEIIRQEAEDEAAEIIAEAESEADRIRSLARQDAEQIRKEAREEIAQSARPEEIRLEHETDLKLRRIRQEAVEDAFQLAVNRLEDRLRDLRGQSRYQESLRNLIQEAWQALEPSLRPDGGWRLVVDGRDHEKVRDLMEEQSLDVEVEVEDIEMGGVIARSDDGQVVVDNTYAARIELALPVYRQDFLSRTLGSDEG